MKKNYLQIGIVTLSSFLILSGVLLFIKGAGQLSKTDILEVNTEDGKVLTPINFDTRISKGDALMASNYYSLAASEYSFAVNLDPKNAMAFSKLGTAYEAMEDYQKAMEVYKKAMEFEPNELNYASQYGESLIQSGNFEAAQGVFDGLKEETQEGKFYGGLLDSFYGRYEDAKKKFEKAKTLKGSISNEDIDKFIKIFGSFELQEEGQELYLKALLTQGMIDINQFQMAEALALNILGVKSDYRDVWIMLGYTQLKSKSYPDAEESLKQAKKLDSIKPETHYFLAEALYFQKKYPEAVNEYELAILYGFQPETEAYKKIAESQLSLNRYEESLEAYEHLIKINPDSIDVFVRPVWIAITYIGDLQRAFSIAEESVTLFPNEAMSHNLLAWAYMEKNELEKADMEIKTAFSIDPNFAEAHYNAGRLREKQGNIEGAKWEYKKAYELAKAGDSISALASERYNALTLANGNN